MESRNKQIMKTSVVIGGNVGNLFAGLGYIFVKGWDVGGQICGQYVPEFVAQNFNLTENFYAFADTVVAPYAAKFSTTQADFLGSIRDVVRGAGSGHDVIGIYGVFERAAQAGFDTLKNETVSYYYNQTSTALMQACTDFVSAKNIVPVCYVGGALVGFTLAAGYQLMIQGQENIKAKVEDKAEPVQAERVEVVEPVVTMPELRKAVSYDPTLFSDSARVIRKHSGSLQELHEKYSNSVDLKKLAEEEANKLSAGLTAK